MICVNNVSLLFERGFSYQLRICLVGRTKNIKEGMVRSFSTRNGKEGGHFLLMIFGIQSI